MFILNFKKYQPATFKDQKDYVVDFFKEISFKISLITIQQIQLDETSETFGLRNSWQQLKKITKFRRCTKIIFIKKINSALTEIEKFKNKNHQVKLVNPEIFLIKLNTDCTPFIKFIIKYLIIYSSIKNMIIY